MDFDELQKNWQAQPINMPENWQSINAGLTEQWHKQQRSVLRSNLFTTIGFAGAVINFVWVYITFHKGHTVFFGGSLLFMSVLLVVYLGVLWQGYALKKNDPTVSSMVYINQSIKKLVWRRKTITHFGWIYAILLWAALMLYMQEVTTGGSLAFRIGAPLVTTVYIFGIMIIMRKTKQKKQLKKIDSLITDLQVLREKMEA